MQNDPTSLRNEQKQIRQVTWIGLVCNVLLSGAKCLIGFVANSQALIADGIHSLSDITTDAAILLGERFWLAPADDTHPYGHRRIEAMITALISLLLTAAAFGIGYDALRSLHVHTNTPPGWTAFVVAITSIILKEILFRYTYHVGIRIRSSAVKANAVHHRADAFSSIPVAIAVLIAIIKPQWAFVDHVGALIVAAFILYAAWNIIKPALAELSDIGACTKTQTTIRETTLAVDGVKDVHAIRSRRNGPGFFVDLHVLVDPNLTVKEGHDIARNVKYTLLTNIMISDVIVHIEPYGDAASIEKGIDT